MAKYVIFKMSNGKTVQKLNALFIVEESFTILIKENRKLPYFFVAYWDISKAIHKWGQESISTLLRHMIHMYIHNTLIPNML